MEECPYVVDNKNLMHALILRKEGKYKEGYAALKRAVAENCHDATVLKQAIDFYGGFGVKPFLTQYREQFSPPINFKSVSATVHIYRHRFVTLIVDQVDTTEYLKHCCYWNDPFALYLLGDFKKASEQQFNRAFIEIIDYYMETDNFVEGAKWIVKLPREDMISDYISNSMEKDNLSQHYIFGKWLSKENNRRQTMRASFLMCVVFIRKQTKE
jgi:hypothetical protein